MLQFMPFLIVFGISNYSSINSIVRIKGHNHELCMTRSEDKQQLKEGRSYWHHSLVSEMPY